MTRLTYEANWSGELAAGIHPGSEEITITFKYDQPLDSDVTEYWRDSIAEFYDGATVTLIETETSR